MSYGAILEKDFSEYANKSKSSITLPLEKAVENYNDWPNPGPLANLFYFSHSMESLLEQLPKNNKFVCFKIVDIENNLLPYLLGNLMNGIYQFEDIEINIKDICTIEK